MVYIRANVIGEYISVKEDKPKVATGSIDTIVQRCAFDNSWNGYAKTGIFWKVNGEAYSSIFDGNDCIVPHEAMSKEGAMRFGVYGIKDDKRLVTERISYNIVKGAYDNSEESEPPIAPTWEEVMALIDELREQTKGEQGEKGDKGDPGNGIVSIVLTDGTGESGSVDTYTITMDNGDTYDFIVHNGVNGADGISPTVSTSQISGGTRVTITDASGETYFDVLNGEQGQQGIQGDPGKDAPQIDDTIASSSNPWSGNKVNEELELIKDDIEYKKSNFIEMKKIKNYLYEIWYQDIDYDYASKYFEENGAVDVGACSSIRNGNFYGRNFDWLYDNKVSFIVHTPKIANRYSSTGVTGTVPEMTNEFVESGEQSLIYKLVPFFLVDGINEHGLVVNTNVVPAGDEPNIGVPSGTSDITLSNMMIIRYILDNFSSAEEAVNYITNHATIYPHKSLSDMRYDLHWMIADEDDTYLIEIIDGEIVATDINDKPYMTNFHITGVNFNSDGTVYTPYTQDSTHNAIDTNLIEELGSGLERYNLLVNGYDNANTKAGMRSLMDSIKYTNAYTITVPENVWYTEFVGVNGMTVGTSYVDYADTLSAARNLYEERTRTNPQTWQTVHSSVYDIHDKKLYLVIQEDNSETEYGLDTYSSAAIDDGKITQNNTWSASKISNELFEKQGVISDLSSIRSGATDGSTAIQSVNGKSGKSISLTADDIGIDIISPIITVTNIENGHRVTITDVDGDHVFDVANGSDGINGIDGTNGIDGNDGVSPIITIDNITNGHRVNITDVSGTNYFDITNGQNGTDGTNGTNGADGEDGKPGTVVSSTQPDYDALWINPEDAACVAIPEMSDIPAVDDIRTDIAVLQRENTARALECENLKQILYGSVAEEAVDRYASLDSASLHSSVIVEGSPYPVIEGTRLMLDKVEGKTSSAKNILSISGMSFSPSGGITLTVNSDGTLTANGTATAETNFFIDFQVGSNKQCKFVGCPAGGSESNRYDIYLWDRDAGARAYRDSTLSLRSLSDTGNGAEAYLITGTQYRYAIRFRNGYTADNLVFKPMLTEDLSATYEDFEPYFDGLKSPSVNGITVTKDGVTQTISIPQTTLRGVGDAKDYIEVVKNGDGLYDMVKHVLTASGNTAPASGDCITDGTTYVYPAQSETVTTVAADLPYDQVTAINNGGTLAVTGNAQSGFVRPDVSLDVVIRRAAE